MWVLLSIGGTTFLEHVAASILGPRADRVIAVVGHDAPRVLREVRLPSSVLVVVNDAYADGMLGSVIAGLDAAEGDAAEAVLLHPVDHPLVEGATVDAVVAELRAGARIAVPSHGGRRGHPGGFARAAWAALRAAPASEGARFVLASHPDWITHVAAGPGCVAGVDTLEDYRRLIPG